MWHSGWTLRRIAWHAMIKNLSAPLLLHAQVAEPQSQLERSGFACAAKGKRRAAVLLPRQAAGTTVTRGPRAARQYTPKSVSMHARWPVLCLASGELMLVVKLCWHRLLRASGAVCVWGGLDANLCNRASSPWRIKPFGAAQSQREVPRCKCKCNGAWGNLNGRPRQERAMTQARA